jgi:hypothetical protein
MVLRDRGWPNASGACECHPTEPWTCLLAEADGECRCARALCADATHKATEYCPSQKTGCSDGGCFIINTYGVTCCQSASECICRQGLICKDDELPVDVCARSSAFCAKGRRLIGRCSIAGERDASAYDTFTIGPDADPTRNMCRNMKGAIECTCGRICSSPSVGWLDCVTPCTSPSDCDGKFDPATGKPFTSCGGPDFGGTLFCY